MQFHLFPAVGILVGILVSIGIGSARTPVAPKVKPHSIVGTWRANIQFSDGEFAAIKDLKFLITLNQEGTLVESANYDSAPPVPPAYGIWRLTGKNEFELRYEFFNSKPLKKVDDLTNAGGWLPGGYGVLREKVKLSSDGNKYASKLTLELFDEKGKRVPGIFHATCTGERMKF